MDLQVRTLAALDWPVVLDALASHARTPRGAAACRVLGPLPDRETIIAAHDAVDELRQVAADGGDLPVDGVEDVGIGVDHAAKGELLELEVLQRIGVTLTALRRLEKWGVAQAEDAPTLSALASEIALDTWVVQQLERAFDGHGGLSRTAWPELASLEDRILELHASIRSTLDTLLKDESLADVLQDTYVTQRRDRYVLPVKSRAKRWDLGIVHDTSSSGATVFIEPAQVVSLNNALRVAEGERDAEIRRIRAELSNLVGTDAPAILTALDAATALDLVCARTGLSDALAATRPKVGEQGVINLREARHPVLALRGVDVVPNDLRVGGTTHALVLSGPNAGGKTVALKTLGLCALLVRIGCFVPAAAGSRVDRFDTVLAHIGDAQSIEGDLSSFSGQILWLGAMLDAADQNSLLMIDEIATGTDPGQGAALAQALLEAILDEGARVVVTTHYARLKGLAAADPRFSTAAVELVNGEPTYRVLADSTGESHALNVAARMGLPEAILDRARTLLGTTERSFTEALEALEAERSRAAMAMREAEASSQEIASERARLNAERLALKERARELERREAGAFLERLRNADRAVSAVVAELQRAPGHQGVQAAREAIAKIRAELSPEEEVEQAPASLAVGDRVRLRTLGREGEVVALKGGKVRVSSGGVTVQVKPEALEWLGGPMRRAAPTKGASSFTPAPDVDRDRLHRALRLPTNTLDLRGMRVDDALDAVDRFLDDAVIAQHNTVFVLHGHGTGALKDAVRGHIPSSAYVGAWAPASEEQGGDAFTVIVVTN